MFQDRKREMDDWVGGLEDGGGKVLRGMEWLGMLREGGTDWEDGRGIEVLLEEWWRSVKEAD